MSNVVWLHPEDEFILANPRRRGLDSDDDLTNVIVAGHRFETAANRACANFFGFTASQIRQYREMMRIDE